jgi:hypothetical protein
MEKYLFTEGIFVNIDTKWVLIKPTAQIYFGLNRIKTAYTLHEELRTFMIISRYLQVHNNNY